jgi:hypothetical protein
MAILALSVRKTFVYLDTRTEIRWWAYLRCHTLCKLVATFLVIGEFREQSMALENAISSTSIYLLS